MYVLTPDTCTCAVETYLHTHMYCVHTHTIYKSYIHVEPNTGIHRSTHITQYMCARHVHTQVCVHTKQEHHPVRAHTHLHTADVWTHAYMNTRHVHVDGTDTQWPPLRIHAHTRQHVRTDTVTYPKTPMSV